MNIAFRILQRIFTDANLYKHKNVDIITISLESQHNFGYIVFKLKPYIHAQGLNAIYVDRLVNHISWNQFIDKLDSEWEAFTLYSIAILNANIAFLAVPNVNPTTLPCRPSSTACLAHSSCGDCLTHVLVGCAVGLVTLLIWAVWDTHSVWWLYPTRQRIKRNFQYRAMHNCLFGLILHQSPARPSPEKGALMPLDNDSGAAGTDSG
ncbi:hypothetical protein EV702DRAFT_1041043 [Suillus placidus]|uniref:Uncharacterized protein n=1 Tax=Suillus placidus TaxID=48579 RepID=A0A9P7A6H4_9AGAM|nr:hypothetical protein EV702DRAFT_1041043 [Suillus placidus]